MGWRSPSFPPSGSFCTWLVRCGALAIAGCSHSGDAVATGAGDGGLADAASSPEAAASPDADAETQNMTPRADAGDAGVDLADSGSPEDGSSDAVSGVVVDKATARPLGGRRVRVGGSTTTTDSMGRFNFEQIGPVYDAVIADADGTTVTIYQGVSRRDPVLAHTPSKLAVSAMYAGAAQGTLSGPSLPLTGPRDRVDISFFSPEATDTVTLASTAGLSPGPAYTVRAQWSGTPTVSGGVFALATLYPASDGGDSDAGPEFWTALVDATLTSMGTASLDLALLPAAPITVSGVVQSQSYAVTGVGPYYRAANGAAILRLPMGEGSVSSFAFEVPDVTSVAHLCVAATHLAALGEASIRAESCGIAPGSTTTNLALPDPPSLVRPAAGDAVGNGAPLSWNSTRDGIYALELQPAGDSYSAPNVTLYTASRVASWPDVSVDALPYGAGTFYDVSVGELTPFATMDDFVGPFGMGAPYRTQTVESYGAAVQVTTE